MTRPYQQHLDTLTEIRSLMERSSRFISLSGLSGVAAGVFALMAAGITYGYLKLWPFQGMYISSKSLLNYVNWGMHAYVFFVLTGFLTFSAAIISGIFFTTRKAKRKGQKIWDSLTKRLLINLAIPLFAGGVFCIALIFHGFTILVAPATLIFYGLSLVNSSKYTLHDVRYLGLSEIGLGLISLFFLGFGLEFWSIGFGILHIAYGMIMYVKYER